MAIGWLGLLKSVPWNDVVNNAPKVADGAKKLWGSVKNKLHPDEVETTQEEDQASNSSLLDRLSALEARSDDVQRQLLTSSELIKSLAEQNTLLISRVDTLYARVRWLLLFSIGTTIALGLLFFYRL